MISDRELSTQTAVAAGALLLSLRESFGAIDPGDRARADLLRKEGDRQAHELIVAEFARHRPADMVLSEEGKDDLRRLDADRVWIVDPLDGTWEYGQGRADFAVHIVLWQRGAPLTASTVELPAQGLTRTSDDDVPLMSGLPVDRPIRIVASRTRPPATLGRAVEILADRLDHPVEVVDVGSVGAKVNEILSGRADAYVHNTGFYEWDVAAPYAVAHRYGLHASHINGSPIAFNADPVYVRDLLVSVPALHQPLVAALEEAGADEAGSGEAARA